MPWLFRVNALCAFLWIVSVVRRLLNGGHLDWIDSLSAVTTVLAVWFWLYFAPAAQLEITMRKNPAAVALGRRGGKANTAAQRAWQAQPKPGAGRPKLMLPCGICGVLTQDRDPNRRPKCQAHQPTS